MNSVVRALGAVGQGLLVVLTVLVVVEVAARFITGRSVPGTVEYVEVVMVAAIFLSLALAEKEGAHVRVTSVHDRLPVGVKEGTRALGAVVSVGFLTVMTCATAIRATNSLVSREFRFGIAEVPIWPARMAIALGTLVLTIEVIRTFMREREVDGPDAPRAATEGLL